MNAQPPMTDAFKTDMKFGVHLLMRCGALLDHAMTVTFEGEEGLSWGTKGNMMGFNHVFVY